LEDRPGHLGLRAVRERASAVGGGVAVSSSPGRGTTVVCRLPWSLEPSGFAAGSTSSD
jgi:signal transduction histidine kinase